MFSNPFLMVLAMYGTVMCGALALLIWAFNGRFNLSGRLFLLSELLRFPVVGIIALVHIEPDYRIGAAYFTINALFLLSETAFVLSVYALSRGHGYRHATLICAGLFLLCVVIELTRLRYPHLPFLLYSITYGLICFFTTLVCSFKSNQSTYQTPFWQVLKYIEATFVLLSLLRIIFFFWGEGFSPIGDGALNLFILAIILSLLIFRYIAYQSIWMTWVPPDADENLLNQNLIRTLRERDRILKRLLASNRRIGVSALASSIAHQLSQPLTGAALYIETVKRKLITQDSEADIIDAMDRVSDQLRKMASLVLNLRGLFSETKSNFKPSDLASLCDEIIELAANSSLAKNITFEKHYEASPLIVSDALQLQQVMINIIENALQALKASKTVNPFIKITIKENKSHGILIIEDNAGGISPDLLPSLFELYETTKDDGGGVGLWLCKTIIEKHGGTIEAENSVDGGARFTLALPLAR